jgi:hypothetical protein
MDTRATQIAMMGGDTTGTETETETIMARMRRMAKAATTAETRPATAAMDTSPTGIENGAVTENTEIVMIAAAIRPTSLATKDTTEMVATALGPVDRIIPSNWTMFRAA